MKELKRINIYRTYIRINIINSYLGVKPESSSSSSEVELTCTAGDSGSLSCLSTTSVVVSGWLIVVGSLVFIVL